MFLNFILLLLLVRFVVDVLGLVVLQGLAKFMSTYIASNNRKTSQTCFKVTDSQLCSLLLYGYKVVFVKQGQRSATASLHIHKCRSAVGGLKRAGAAAHKTLTFIPNLIM